MTTLDRYIIRLFLTNLVILFAVLFLLFTVMDMMADFDEFIQAGEVFKDKYGAGYSDSAAKLIAILAVAADYYGPILLLMYTYFSGLVIFGAMGFTFIAMVRSRELVAMVTSGISMHRLAAPVLIIGGLLNLATLPLQEFAIPPLAEKLSRNKSELKSTESTKYQFWYAPDGKDNLFSAGEFDLQNGLLQQVTILERTEKGTLTRRIEAQQAIWVPTGESTGYWDLINGRALLPGDPNRPIVTEFATDLSPEVLFARRAEIYAAVISLRDLYRMLGKESASHERIVRIMHGRFSFAIVNILILLMGTPFYMLREPRNMLAEGGKAALVGFATWGLAILVIQVGFQQYMPPETSAWLPVVVYLPISAWLLSRVRT